MDMRLLESRHERVRINFGLNWESTGASSGHQRPWGTSRQDSSQAHPGGSHLETAWCFVRVSEAMGYLTSGHGVNPSLGPLSRRPVAQGPEVRYPTPSATCEIMGQWFLIDTTRWRLGLVGPVSKYGAPHPLLCAKSQANGF